MNSFSSAAKPDAAGGTEVKTLSGVACVKAVPCAADSSDMPGGRTRALLDRLEGEHSLSRDEWVYLFEHRDAESLEYLKQKARAVADRHFGKDIYTRGLIEFTNYCRNDCLYCGIRRSNRKAERYRLTREEIMECAALGHELGFRTFVMQGGEDMHFTDEYMCEIISGIKEAFPDSAVTLSVGERDRETYQRYFDAGADRFLLRHETVTPEHYSFLHNGKMSIETRLRCLNDLKSIGFQVGCGMMIGSPGQTVDNLVSDLIFISEFRPHMVGMGPFIPHNETPFKNEPAGSLEDTLHLLSIVRLMLPEVLLPATTALGTLVPTGRELGAGANVVMPNLSPVSVRKKYMLYDGKISTGEEAAECLEALSKRIDSTGYKIAMVRGDHSSLKK